MLLHLLYAAGGILTGALSELLPIKTRGTVDSYVEVKGEGSWEQVVKFSLLGGLIAGLVSTFVNKDLSIQGSQLITMLVAMMGYMSVQTYMTDIAILKIDRFMLRVGYIVANAIAVVLIKLNPELTSSLPFFLTSVITFMILFFVVSIGMIGMSDIRVMLITVPISTILFKAPNIAWGFYVAIFIISYIYQKIKNKITGETPLYPMGPLFIIPYLVVFALLGLFI